LTEAVVAAYLVLVLGIGAFARRRLAATGEDYFAASRTIGPVVLLATLFGTHMTAFSLLGASGEAYHRGVGVFSLMASSSALVVPAVFWFVAPRAWAVCRRNGFLTQVEMVRARWESPGLAVALGAVLAALLVPYLLIGVMGGGITLAEITDGRVPQWAGSLAMVLVVLAYVTAGGIRGTSWVNTFQTVVFIVLGAVTAGVVAAKTGGLGALASRVDPALLVHGDRIPALELVTYILIPLSVGTFPHIFSHWLSAESPRTFKLPIVAYPLCVAAVWLPSVLVGVLASADLPGLEGSAANSVLIRAIDLHAPGALAGLLAAGVFAAVMSSLDSQSLALSSLVTRGLGRRRRGDEGRRHLLLGRMFVALILTATFALSLVAERSIFRLGVWSFTGFAALFPLVVAALWWRRATAAGAWASLLTAAGLWLYYFVHGTQNPGYTIAGTGAMPVAVILPAAALALIVVSLLTRPPSDDALDRFFPEGSR
jgi:SSS family solute:Na+ symporter